MSRTKMDLAVVATALALAGPVRADQITVSYNVARGFCSKPIAVPANNKPILLAGTNLEDVDPGEGHVTLLHVPGAGGYLSWEGSDSSEAHISGHGSTAGLLIMYLDQSSYVAVETYNSSRIYVCNSQSNDYNAFGYLTFFY